MFLNDINERLGAIDAELEVLRALPDPTEEDATRTESLATEVLALREERTRSEERTARILAAADKAKTEGTTIRGLSFEYMKKADPYDVDVRMLDADQVRDASFAVLDRSEARHLDADQKAHALKVISAGGSRVARLVLATSRPEYRRAWAKISTGRVDMLTPDEARASSEARTALALADANGGYAVPALLDPSVIYTGNGTANPMRQVSRIVTGMDDTWRGVTSAGITASWDSEGIQVSDDGPTLGTVSVVSHKASAFVPFSVEIEGDWAGLASEMGILFAESKDVLETAAFATGSGAADNPTGILTDLFAASATVGVLPTTDGAFGAIDVRAVFGALGPRYRPNATFMSSIDAMNEVRGFDTTGGLSNQTVNLSAPYDFAVLGRQYLENSGFPDFTGTTGASNILVVGDFRNYVIFDRVGSHVELVPLVMGANGRPTGQRGLYYWWRVGGKCVNTSAFRLLLNA